MFPLSNEAPLQPCCGMVLVGHSATFSPFSIKMKLGDLEMRKNLTNFTGCNSPNFFCRNFIELKLLHAFCVLALHNEGHLTNVFLATIFWRRPNRSHYTDYRSRYFCGSVPFPNAQLNPRSIFVSLINNQCLRNWMSWWHIRACLGLIANAKHGQTCLELRWQFNFL